MPRMNNHERMKVLSLLNREFKSIDKKKSGKLSLYEFKLMKDFILRLFSVFYQYTMMDEQGEGQVDINAFLKHFKELELPEEFKEKNGHKVFDKIDKNDDKTISLYEWLQVFG